MGETTLMHPILNSVGTGLTMGIIKRLADGDKFVVNKQSLSLAGMSWGAEALSKYITPMVISNPITPTTEFPAPSDHDKLKVQKLKIDDVMKFIAPTAMSGLAYAGLDMLFGIDKRPIMQQVFTQILASSASRSLMDPIVNLFKPIALRQAEELARLADAASQFTQEEDFPVEAYDENNAPETELPDGTEPEVAFGF
jgi:hypothetical protein